MKAIFRNFAHVLRRFKTASILNVLGLSAALVVFTVCAIQTYYDMTFNRSLKNAGNLYQLSFYQNTNYGEQRDFVVRYRTSEILKLNQPRLNASNMFLTASYGGQNIEYELNGKKQNKEINITSIELQFINLSGMEIIAGNGHSALADINKLIISQKTAEQLFGNESPIGKSITTSMSLAESDENGAWNSWYKVSMTIVAVYKDFSENSSLDNGMYTLFVPDRYEKFNSTGTSAVSIGTINTYFLANSKQEKTEIEKLLSDKKMIDLLNISPPRKENIKDANGEGELEVLESRFELIPLSNIHLNYPDAIPRKAKNWTNVLSLIAIGLSTLLIAYINFVNFISAMAPVRIRSINIQKILGAEKRSLRFSVILETIFFTTLAFVIALFVVYYVSVSFLAEFFTASLLPNENVLLLIVLFVILILLSILVALFPSSYLTSFDPVVSYGGAVAGKKGSKLRGLLTVFQFTAACILIFVALFIKLQHHYFQSYNIGMDNENVIVVTNKDASGKVILENTSPFINEAKGKDGVLDGTASTFLFGLSGISTVGQGIDKDTYIMYANFPAARNFLDIFKIDILQGKKIAADMSRDKIIVVNQKMVDKYGLEVVEKYITEGEAMVIENFNFSTLYSELTPLSIELGDNPSYSYIYFRLSGADMNQSIKTLEKAWSKFSAAPFDYSFVDEKIDSLYKQESNLAVLLGVFALTAILIAIMGVYGLITFNSKYRAKEIAIRKVQGSTIKRIMLLLNRGILVQFAIAFVIAVPVAYYIVNKWLEQFVYKTPVYWWVFLLGALMVLLITLLTVSVQSYRAAAANPIGALKDE